ncbi:MAG TPA: universal stress protein [bacterium]|jgi:nucleotide-binding universal stress UspA family protein
MVLDERIPYASSGETTAARERLSGTGELSSKLFENVLIPTDLDPAAKPLVTLAADLAGRFHSQFVLVHVVPHEPTLARDPAVLRERRTELEKLAAKLRDAGASYVQTILMEGNPAYHIEQAARQHHVSVILLSERSDASQTHAWFGTLTQKLARRVDVPLMVVRPVGQHTLKPVLCVVDFTESSRKALKYAIALSRQTGTPLAVLHVVPEPLPSSMLEGPIWQGCGPADAGGKRSYAASQNPDATTSTLIEDNRRTTLARREVEDFLSRFDFSGVKHDVVVRSGSPVVEALMVAKEHKSGVIAIGADHRSGFVHLMSQSTAETLAETADIPVLIFRSAGERPKVVGARSNPAVSLPIN